MRWVYHHLFRSYDRNLSNIANIRLHSVSGHTYDNKFYMVSFIIGKTGNTKEIFESLKDKLQNKYPNYKYEEEENNIKFQDNTTLLILRNNTFDKTAENYLSLTYIDLNLSKKKIDDKISKNYSDEL